MSSGHGILGIGIGRTLAALAVLLLAPIGARAGICLSEQVPHPCDTLLSCDAALRLDALDVAARLKLCDLHVDKGQLVEASIAVRRGLQLCTGQRRACSVLERALSNVEEQRLAQERDRGPEETKRRRDVLRGYCLGNVTTNRTVAACEEIVANEPNAELYAALVRKLLQIEQPARALSALRDAEGADIGSPDLAALEADAVALRAAAVRACDRDGKLEACDAALLTNAPDESTLLRARGRILAASGAHREAFRALEDAFRLTADRDTASLITGLDASRFPSDDVDFLRLRASAYRVLGNARSETSTLQRLVALDAADADARARLARLVPVSTPATPAAAPRPAPEQIEQIANVPTRAQEAEPGEITASGQPREPAGTPATFDNSLLADGRTH